MSKIDDYKSKLNPEELANHERLVDVLTDLELTRTYGPGFGRGLIEFDPATQPVPDEPQGEPVSPEVRQVTDALMFAQAHRARAENANNAPSHPTVRPTASPDFSVAQSFANIPGNASGGNPSQRGILLDGQALRPGPAFAPRPPTPNLSVGEVFANILNYAVPQGSPVPGDPRVPSAPAFNPRDLAQAAQIASYPDGSQPFDEKAPAQRNEPGAVPRSSAEPDLQINERGKFIDPSIKPEELVDPRWEDTQNRLAGKRYEGVVSDTKDLLRLRGAELNALRDFDNYQLFGENYEKLQALIAILSMKDDDTRDSKEVYNRTLEFLRRQRKIYGDEHP